MPSLSLSRSPEPPAEPELESETEPAPDAEPVIESAADSEPDAEPGDEPEPEAEPETEVESGQGFAAGTPMDTLFPVAEDASSDNGGSASGASAASEHIPGPRRVR